MPILSRELKAAAQPYFSGDKESFATTLVAGLLRLYGVEALEWDPLTIQMEIKEDLGVDMPRRVYDKMMALVYQRTRLSSDRHSDLLTRKDGSAKALK